MTELLKAKLKKDNEMYCKYLIRGIILNVTLIVKTFLYCSVWRKQDKFNKLRNHIKKWCSHFFFVTY